MNNGLLGRAAAGSALLLLSSQVLATQIIVPSNSSIRFNFAGVDAATVFYDPAQLPCTSGAACDAAALPAPGSPPGTQPGAPGAINVSGIDSNGDGVVDGTDVPVLEDTWGIGRVDTVAVGLDPFYTSGLTSAGNPEGTSLGIFFAGLADIFNIPSGGSTTTFSQGGLVQIWEQPIVNIAADPDPNDRIAPGGAGSLGPVGGFPGITQGELILELAFAPGCSPIQPLATLCGAFNNSTFGGGSAAVFDVTGGSLGPIFDTNSVEDALGNLHDFEGSFTFECLNPGPVANNQAGCDPTALNLFSVNVNGPIVGSTPGDTPVPEPSALILMTGGLLGLFGFARRRQG